MITFKELGKHGQLGNQLFQIASTIGIAIKNKQPYIFPNWEYSRYFENPLPQTDDAMANFKTFNETSKQEFHCVPLRLTGDWSLYGYFQNVSYFRHCETLIRRYFEPEHSLRDKLLRAYGDVLGDSCAIHVRRTGSKDWVTKDSFWMPMQYYQMAVQLLPKVKHYLVFSNNIPWCKQHFKGENFTFVKGQSAIEDLLLMSMCKHNIIGNSTFSWWSAWLNTNPHKQVVAPAPWLGWTRGDLNMASLVQQDWHKIDISNMVFSPSAKVANCIIGLKLPLLPRFARFAYRRDLLKHTALRCRK